jgi:hypothetical protein
MLSQKPQIFRQRLRPRQALSLQGAAVPARPSAFPQIRHSPSASIQPPACPRHVRHRADAGRDRLLAPNRFLTPRLATPVFLRREFATPDPPTHSTFDGCNRHHYFAVLVFAVILSVAKDPERPSQPRTVLPFNRNPTLRIPTAKPSFQSQAGGDPGFCARCSKKM